VIWAGFGPFQGILKQVGSSHAESTHDKVPLVPGPQTRQGDLVRDRNTSRLMSRFRLCQVRP
jgi:hypothetical protein